MVHSSCRPVCHSPEPQTPSIRVSYPRPTGLGRRCSEHKLDGSHCLCLPSNGSPLQGDRKIRQYHYLIILIAPGWPGMPWFWDLVQLSTEIPLQLPVSTTLLKQSHSYVFHSNPQHLNLHARCLGADNSRSKAFLWRWQRELLLLRDHQQEPYTSQSGPYLNYGAEKIWWISPPSIKQISDFFMYLHQDLNRRLSTIDGYRTAIVETLGPTAQHIAHYPDLHRFLSSFHRDRPKSSRNLPSGTFLLFSI